MGRSRKKESPVGGDTKQGWSTQAWRVRPLCLAKNLGSSRPPRRFSSPHLHGMLVEMKGKLVVIACVLALLAAGYLLYEHITHLHREAAYHAAIAPFERDLTHGMSKASVEDYLRARNIEHNTVQVGGSPGPRIEVQIGEEPGSLVCAPWRVYAAFEFNSQDALTDIHIVKVGTCL